MAVPLLITARLGSSRLPKKCLLPLGGVSVIEHIALRAHHFGFDPIICCPLHDEDEIREHSETGKVFGYTADECDELVTACAIHYGIKIFHHIDGDDPFFDRDSVIESMQCFLRGKFSRIKPSAYSQSGAGMVGTSYNLNAPSDAEIGVLPDPAMPIWPLRLTLDYEEDYQLLCAVNRMVGGYMAPWHAIESLFQRNPDLHKINYFRNSEWKTKQNADRLGVRERVRH